MFYTVYKTTNVINGKFYIGKHQTKNLDDGYLGSGKLLKYAIKKYSKSNFHKEIRYVCDNEQHMNVLEKILVVPDIEINYNLCHGGKGGFSFINNNKLNDYGGAIKGGINSQKALTQKRKNDKKFDSFFRERCSLGQKQRHENGNGFIPSTKGMKFSENTKSKMSKSNTGKNNSQYGTCWVTNGIENKKVHKNDLVLWEKNGYKRGRL